jgi:pyruvate-ferredoxin/flavodoxin oxidoreductase
MTPTQAEALEEPQERQFPFPGVPTTADGAAAVVWAETHISQGACAYPITPSTTMGSGFEIAVANGVKNLWGDQLIFVESESEHSAATT